MRGFKKMKTFVPEKVQNELLNSKKKRTVVTVKEKEQHFGTGHKVDLKEVTRGQKKMFKKEETIIEKKGKKFKEIKIETKERKSVIPTNKLPLVAGRSSGRRKRSKGKRSKKSSVKKSEVGETTRRKKKISKHQTQKTETTQNRAIGVLGSTGELEGDGMLIRVSNGEDNFLRQKNSGAHGKVASNEFIGIGLAEENRGALERRNTQGRRSASNGKISVNKGSYLNAKMEQFEETVNQKVLRISEPAPSGERESVDQREYHTEGKDEESSYDEEEVGYVHDIYSYRDSVPSTLQNIDSRGTNDLQMIAEIIEANPGLTERVNHVKNKSLDENQMRDLVAGRMTSHENNNYASLENNLEVKGVLKRKTVGANSFEKPKKRVSFSNRTQNFQFQKGQMLEKGFEKLNNGSYQETVLSQISEPIYSEESQVAGGTDSEQMRKLESLNKQESFQVNMGSMESEGLHYGTSEGRVRASNTSSMRFRSPGKLTPAQREPENSPQMFEFGVVVDVPDEDGNEIVFHDGATERGAGEGKKLYSAEDERKKKFRGKDGFGNQSQDNKGSERDTAGDYFHLTRSQEPGNDMLQFKTGQTKVEREGNRAIFENHSGSNGKKDTGVSPERVTEFRMMMRNKGDLINFPGNAGPTGILKNKELKNEDQVPMADKRKVNFNFHKSGTFKEEIRNFNQNSTENSRKGSETKNNLTIKNPRTEPYVIREIGDPSLNNSNPEQGSKRSMKGNKAQVFYFQDSNQVSDTEESPRQPHAMETPNFGAFWASEHRSKEANFVKNGVSRFGRGPNLRGKNFVKKEGTEEIRIGYGGKGDSGLRGYEGGIDEMVVNIEGHLEEDKVGNISQDLIVISKLNSGDTLDNAEREVAGAIFQNETSIMVEYHYTT